MKRDKVSQMFNNYTPKSDNQKKYVKYLADSNTDIVIVTGPAGTGKTMFACLRAIELLKKGEIKKIVVTRPLVTVEEELGFLPGNIAKKMDPWTKPLFDLFSEFYSKTEIDNLVYNNIIEICPLAFMRGRTFKHSFIIADEMQNSSPNQMKMLTTRIGINSKMIITGDLAQTDLLRDNGLYDFVNKIKNYNQHFSIFNKNKPNENLIEFVEFENKDIERSEIVKKIVDIYDFKILDEKINSEPKVDEPYVKEPNVTKTNIIETNIIESEPKKIINDDCALIPKKHLSKHYESDFKPDYSLYY